MTPAPTQTKHTANTNQASAQQRQPRIQIQSQHTIINTNPWYQKRARIFCINRFEYQTTLPAPPEAGRIGYTLSFEWGADSTAKDVDPSKNRQGRQALRGWKPAPQGQCPAVSRYLWGRRRTVKCPSAKSSHEPHALREDCANRAAHGSDPSCRP